MKSVAPEFIAAVEFSGAHCGKAFIVEGEALTVGDESQVLSHDNGWYSSPELAKLLKDETPLTLRESYSHWCVNAVQKDDKSAMLIVEDEGIGMSKETLDRIFTPFFTTKPPGEGTGLGMSISMTIVEEHNGKINITSEEGKGTRVTVLLPLA